jgi:hypothetical protein
MSPCSPARSAGTKRDCFFFSCRKRRKVRSVFAGGVPEACPRPRGFGANFDCQGSLASSQPRVSERFPCEARCLLHVPHRGSASRRLRYARFRRRPDARPRSSPFFVPTLNQRQQTWNADFARGLAVTAAPVARRASGDGVLAPRMPHGCGVRDRSKYQAASRCAAPPKESAGVHVQFSIR